MKHSLRYPVALAALVLASLTAQAQTEPIKFGKPDPKDFTAAPFVGDSAAAAVVLCDYGTTNFQYNNNDFQLISERTTRIKILKKAGYDAATVEIPLYHRGDSQEKISGLRGTTYNLVNGQVVKTKLDGTNTFTEDRTANVRVRKFTLPDVREGSVIEFNYTVISDFLFNFQDWTFQRDIPVRWSEFRANIPEYFHYKMLQQGYHALAVQSQSESAMQFTVHTAGGFTGSGMATTREAGSSDAVSTRSTSYDWAMKDVPAFRDEPYMTTSEDYLDRISFQLAGEQFPNQPYRNVSGTWAKIDMELLSSDDFGAQLDRGGFLKDQIVPLVAKYPDLLARAAAVREVVMAAVRYDGTNHYATTASLRKAFDAHRGTSADVNLLLISALRMAGVPANPLLLSTRSHGRVDQTQPMLSRFNYVMALVTLADGKDLLVDATEPLLPCGALPKRCLNQAGRLIMKKAEDGRWVNLTPDQRYVHYQQVALTMDAKGGLTGKVHEEHGGYAAADARQELSSLGEKKYLAQMTRPHSGWTVPKLTVAERENVAKPLALDYEFTQAADDNATADLLYLSPLREFSGEQNPFRHDGRLFPVDFGAPQDETTMVTLTLPAGYELAEMPKPAIVDLPEGGGRFMCTVTATAPGVVQLMSRMSLRKPVYAAEEYTQLREFYRLMLEKQSERLIIKKKA
ncbi:transglutaminase-like putative cysteine protease [Hymenobacter sp. UYAg731]